MKDGERKAKQLAAEMELVDTLLRVYREAKIKSAKEQEAIAVTAAYMAALLISTRQIRPDEAQSNEQGGQ